MRATLGLIGIGLVACGPVSDERTIRIEGEFDAVRIELSNGELEVYEAPGDQVLLDVDFGGVARPGTLGRYVEDGTLVIDYRCAFCGGDVQVGVPASMPVDVYQQHGELELEGLSGVVTAELHAGSVEGSDLSCATSILNHAGSIELDYSFRPAFVDVEAHLGAVELEVPAGGYQLDLGSNVGVARLVDVFDDPESAESIAAFAHMGEVAIEGF